MIASFLAISLFLSVSYQAPWGKDADLVETKSEQHVQLISKSPLVWLAEKIIWFHKNVISPTDGPRSHYTPSSSQYMLDAIHKHGFFQGYIMGCDRLLRENSDPWLYESKQVDRERILKIDPVPDTLR